MVEDFCIHHRLGRAEPTGAYVITRLKTRRVVTKFRERYRTPMGDLAPEEWLSLIEREVVSDGKEELLRQIENHVRNNFAWLKSDGDIHKHALCCLASHAYEHWDDFRLGSISKHFAANDTGHPVVSGQLALF